MTLSPLRIRVIAAIFTLIAIINVKDIIKDRVFLYHSQSNSLRPEDYRLTILSAEEYKGDHSNAPGWNSSEFTPIEGGAKYASVTTNGRAHVWDFEFPSLIGNMLLGIAGIIAVSPWSRQTSAAGSSVTTDTAAG